MRRRHGLNFCCDSVDLCQVLGPRLSWRAGVKPIHIRKQHQQLGSHHRGNPCGQTVVIAKANLLGRYRIVFIHNRNMTGVEQGQQRSACVEIAAALLAILKREQNLRGL